MSNSRKDIKTNETDVFDSADDSLISKNLDTRISEKGTQLPERYIIKSSSDKRMLICLEAPNLHVHIDPKLTFTGSVARKSPSGTIFLDGVAQCEPFMDHERQVYNLDHHEGCVRSFTLSTCEQALIIYMKGLELQNREWNIFANEPDLDTLLAIWIIFNHARIGKQDTTQRRILFTLVRFEGIIDALGTELRGLCALPPELMRKVQRIVDRLRSMEIFLKKQNRWLHTDYLAYSVEILHKIDQVIYTIHDFVDYQGIHELARTDLSDQRIAVVVEADMGIYEIEPHLNKIYSNRLGVVFLKKGDNAYSVRQMDLFMPLTLETVYYKLNFRDPAVKSNSNSQKWGGAADIGGSPRDSGTRLTPQEIVQACREAVQKPRIFHYAGNFALAAVLIGIIILCAQITRQIWSPELWMTQSHLLSFWTSSDFGFIVVLFVAGTVTLFMIAGSRLWQYGWSFPVGKSWWATLPLVLAGGVISRLWISPELIRHADWVNIISLYLVGMPLVVELLFRSLGHGLLAQNAMIQRSDSRWFISWPNLASAFLFTFFTAVFSISILHIGMENILQISAGAMVLGLSLGMVRERSHSILPAVFFHMLAAGAALLFAIYF